MLRVGCAWVVWQCKPVSPGLRHRTHFEPGSGSHGPLSGTLSASSADVFIEGSTTDAGLGVEPSRPTDLDGDGLLDLAIGAAYDDTNGASSGKMHLVYGL